MNTENKSSDFLLLDKGFDKEHSTHCHLALVGNFQSLYYGVFDLINNRLVALGDYNFKNVSPEISLNIAGGRNSTEFDIFSSRFKEQVFRSPVVGLKFKSVSIGLNTEKCTLVPSPLFDENRKQEIFEFNFSGSVTSANSDFLQEAEIFCLYEAPESLNELYKNVFPNVKVAHYSSSLLESLYIENKFKSELKVYLHFFQNNQAGKNSFFEIIIFNQGKLLFFNSFYYQEKEDIVYYLLFVLDQLQINPAKIILTLLGNIQKSDEAVKLMSEYVKTVEFGKRPGNFEYPSTFDELPLHFYYSLLSHYLYC